MSASSKRHGMILTPTSGNANGILPGLGNGVGLGLKLGSPNGHIRKISRSLGLD